ncbi:MAG TPA: ATP-binding protein, partial [Burkholderiales bacterium]|nr:ATP-binding protein [Burkholderiales bacterium]
LATAKDYMELLFGERVNEKLVGDLNPLDVVEVNFPNASGGFDTKFLEFRFSRVYEQGVLSHLLVTVNDISERIKLQRELYASQERAEAQMDLLMEVLHMEPQVLRNFLVGTRDALEGVNDVLKQPVRHQEDYGQKVASIFRLVHRVKGDAAAAGLRSIESAAHEIENSLDGLRKLPRIGGNDFLALAVRLDLLFARVEALDALLQKFGSLQSVAAETRVEASPWTVYEQLAKRVAERQGKRVSFAYRGVDYEAIPERYRNAIGDMLTQFVRNACVHGIETPEVRSAMGKSPIGELSASVLHTRNSGLEFSLRDDGAGLSVEKIRASVIESGRMSAAEAAASPAAKLLHFIFEPAFSTANSIDEDAGRGVGLDLVKTLAQSLGGRIRLSSVPGSYTEFRVSFPPLSAPQGAERLPEGVAA